MKDASASNVASDELETVIVVNNVGLEIRPGSHMIRGTYTIQLEHQQNEHRTNSCTLVGPELILQ